MSDTDDGESHNVEFKQVRLDLNSAKKLDVGDFKLDIAKEMSAFANTDAGVIVLGYDGKEKKVVNSTDKLEDWIDKNIPDMLEPRLSGFSMKTIGDKEKIVILHIPKGKSIPYRVASVGSSSKNKSYIREYYQRIGTNSKPIPEAIVRTMYRSTDSAIDIEIFPKLLEKQARVHNNSDVGRGSIKLGLYAQPDATRLIEKYYLLSEAFLLSSSFHIMNEEPISICAGMIKDSIIPPTEDIFELDTFDILSKVAKKTNGFLDTTLPGMDNMPMLGAEVVSSAIFDSIYAIHVQTKYACDGMPMKTDNKIIVLGDKNALSEDSWHEESYWVDEKCLVDRYVSFSSDRGNLDIMYAMENYIRKNINNED